MLVAFDNSTTSCKPFNCGYLRKLVFILNTETCWNQECELGSRSPVGPYLLIFLSWAMTYKGLIGLKVWGNDVPLNVRCRNSHNSIDSQRQFSLPLNWKKALCLMYDFPIPLSSWKYFVIFENYEASGEKNEVCAVWEKSLAPATLFKLPIFEKYTVVRNDTMSSEMHKWGQ